MSSHDSSSTVASRYRRIWADLREAITGTEQDFTTGSIGRAIVLLAVPMVLEMLMQSVFEVADIFFVGKLGAEAVAAVGLTAALLVLVFAVGMGLSMAATAMVARRIGEHNPEEAADAAGQALTVTVLISGVIGVVGVIFAADLLRLMGASEAVVSEGTGYCAVLLGGNATILLLFLINAIFRGAGDAVLAMRALALANVLNIGLDPLLIFGWGPVPAMGVTGAAVATTIGRGIGVAYQLSVLMKGTGRVRLRATSFRLNLDVMRRLLRISGPGVVQYLVGTASWLAVIRLIAGFGSAAVAGYTIAVRVIVFALLPSWGMGNAAATLVGQNLGARKPERAEQSVWITGFGNMVFLGLMSLVLMFYPEPIMRVFTDEADVVFYGAEGLRIISYSYVFFAFGMVTVQAFNGAGDTTTPTWINLLCYWMMQIPLAYALAYPFGMGVRGIFVAIAIAQAILALVGVLVFRRGRWKTHVI